MMTAANSMNDVKSPDAVDEKTEAFYRAHPTAARARALRFDGTFRRGEEATLPVEQRAIRQAIEERLRASQWAYHGLINAQATAARAKDQIDNDLVELERLCLVLSRMTASGW